MAKQILSRHVYEFDALTTKALHDKLSIHPASRHGIQAKHGKNNIIACMDQLQQPRQKCLTRKHSARNIL